MVEDIHDMSIIDRVFGFDGEIFKLIYTTFTGLSLLIFAVTGVWLRYLPRNGRKNGPGESS